MVKIGPVFGEFITTEKIKRRNWGDEKDSRGMRIYLIPLIIIFVIAVLLLRLFFVQVVEGSYYRSLSDSNRIKTLTVHAPRGIIFDRSGKPLVFNIPGFRQIIKDETRLIGKEEAISLIAKGEDLEIDSLREYPYKDAMSHLLGYIGQISEEELGDERFAGYSSGQIVGKMGIERRYEDFLKGEDGRALAEIDASGKVIRKLGETDPIPGRNITLTIDADLQNKAFDAMKKVKKGAVVVSTPKGEILALLSKPSFDPNLFTQGKNYKAAASNAASLDPVYKSISEVLSDTKNQPFLNRAIGGTYPPGSTFKLITAAAGLENKIIDTSFSVKDTGIIRLGAFSFANWYYTNYGGMDGDVNVVKGIKRSNDIFFYKLAEKVGLEKISEMAREFSVGKSLGIDLGGEALGLVPTNEWKKKNIGEPWYLGDTYHLGIGQGYVLATPLEVNSWAQIIANDGVLYQPHILKDLGDRKITSDFLGSKTTGPIKEGMRQSCAPTGVAWPLFDFKVKNEKLKVDGKNFLKVASASADVRQITIACKTGTAQHGGEKTLPHAWITLFAPAYDPQIVVTVLVEEGGEGSSVAAPIAKEILTQWFGRK